MLELRDLLGPFTHRWKVSRYTPLVVRLAAPIDYPGNDDDCWIWRGTVDRFGYGQVGVGNVHKKVHRVVYELLVGPIPPDLELDHLCRVCACCNPRHLEPVTHRVNLLRGQTIVARAALASSCPRGHPYSAENTYVQPSAPDSRRCRACARWHESRRPPRIRSHAGR